MNRTHRKILLRIYTDPVNGNIPWRDLESLLIAVGCRRIEGAGSSVTFESAGMRATFHRPHPGKEALRYRVRDVRAFLKSLGVTL
ncbi:MAG: type II toxin-antitoxin system HicA family toxin [Acidithiobacillus sp.]|nr:type II toxin-antitoxin system HicA family toxin [Acidithiobacillus sp.]